jgi:predicted nucleotidyltransferase
MFESVNRARSARSTLVGRLLILRAWANVSLMAEHCSSLDERALAVVRERLEREPAVAAAYLLGSAAAGRLRADSDLDIALLPARGSSILPEQRLALAADLEDLVGRVVDVGILSTNNLVYAKETVANGRVIFERDPAARARFVALVFSMYADLQENRREVLYAYAA